MKRKRNLFYCENKNLKEKENSSNQLKAFKHNKKINLFDESNQIKQNKILNRNLNNKKKRREFPAREREEASSRGERALQILEGRSLHGLVRVSRRRNEARVDARRRMTRRKVRLNQLLL